jgi:ABC-type multidrug transport system permease subunit
MERDGKIMQGFLRLISYLAALGAWAIGSHYSHGYNNGGFGFGGFLLAAVIVISAATVECNDSDNKVKTSCKGKKCH